MAPGITGSLILFGLALLYAKRGWAPSAFSQVLAHHHAGPGADRARRLRLWRRHLLLPVPVHLDVALWRDHAFLLALGLLAASPEYGIAAAIVEQSPAGEMLRRLLPGILVLPLVIGWFAHQAESAHLLRQRRDARHLRRVEHLVLAAFAWTTIGAVRRSDRDRNAALMELRGQREWLSTTLGSIGEGVIATDPNGSVLLLNKIAEQMTGWSVAEARGRPIWEVFRVIDESTRKPRRRPGAAGLARARSDAARIRRAARHPRRAGAAGRALRRADPRLRRLARRRRADLPRRDRAAGARRSASRCWSASSITASRTRSPSCSRWCRRACAKRPAARRRPWRRPCRASAGAASRPRSPARIAMVRREPESHGRARARSLPARGTGRRS